MVGSFMSASAAVQTTISPVMLEIKDKSHTLNLRNLVVEDLLELTLGDTIAEEDGPLGEGLVAVDARFQFVVDMHTDAVLNTMHPVISISVHKRDGY